MTVKGKNDVAVVYLNVSVLLNSADQFVEIIKKFQSLNGIQA